MPLMPIIKRKIAKIIGHLLFLYLKIKKEIPPKRKMRGKPKAAFPSKKLADFMKNLPPPPANPKKDKAIITAASNKPAPQIKRLISSGKEKRLGPSRFSLFFNFPPEADRPWADFFFAIIPLY